MDGKLTLVWVPGKSSCKKWHSCKFYYFECWYCLNSVFPPLSKNMLSSKPFQLYSLTCIWDLNLTTVGRGLTDQCHSATFNLVDL